MPTWLIAPLAIAGFLVVFPLFWCGIVWLVGAMGWRRLAGRYPAAARPEVTARRVATATSARLGVVNYNGTVHVGVSPEGLHLSVMSIFRVGHPPLLIPWDEIEASPPHREWFREVCELRLGQPDPLSITLPRHVLDAAAEAVVAMRDEAGDLGRDAGADGHAAHHAAHDARAQRTRE